MDSTAANMNGCMHKALHLFEWILFISTSNEPPPPFFLKWHERSDSPTLLYPSHFISLQESDWPSETYKHSSLYSAPFDPIIISPSLLSLHNYINWLPWRPHICPSRCGSLSSEIAKRAETQWINYPVRRGSHHLSLALTSVTEEIGWIPCPSLRHTFILVYIILVTLKA